MKTVRLFLLLLLAAPLAAQTRGAIRIIPGPDPSAAQDTAARSPTPIWPKGGFSAMPPELQHGGIFYDPINNQLLMVDSDGKVHRRLNLNNNVVPSMTFTVTKNAKDAQAYDYAYSVSNSPKAKKAGMRPLLYTIMEIHLVVGDTRKPLAALAPPRWYVQANGAPLFVPGSSIPEIKAATGSDGAWVLFEKTDPLGNLTDGAPGTTLTGFVVTSTFKPGFTIAYVRSNGGDVYSGEDLEGVPEIVPWQHDELNSKHVVTIGPRFAPDAPLQQIVADYIQGINRLIKQGDLKASSLFVQNVLATLNAAGSASPLTFTAAPTTAFEAQLLAALKAAIGQ